MAKNPQKDSEMAKRLAVTQPSPIVRRGGRGWEWPYHNNLGTTHARPKNEPPHAGAERR